MSQSVIFSNGAVNAVEDPVELHAHLIGERPPGDVVRRSGRRAGIWKDIRMHLRLEHVHHVGPERLRRGDHERAGRILLAAPTAKAAVARCTVIPVSSSALMNFVAVGKSG